MLRSMTGYGRAQGQLNGIEWVWELRAVNGRGLDIRLRMPQGHDRLEAEARKRLAMHLSRGNIQATLSVASRGANGPSIVNEDMLKSVLAVIAGIEGSTRLAPSTAAEILSLKGILDTSESNTDDKQQAASQRGSRADGQLAHELQGQCGVTDGVAEMLVKLTPQEFKL